MDNAPAEFVDEHAAAAELSTPVQTLRHWRTRGGGPPFCKLGALVRYHLPTVRAWALAQQVLTTTEHQQQERLAAS